MRIAYVLTSLGMGGAERQVVALAGCMAARGHSVLLLVLRERPAEASPTGVEVISLNMHKTPLSIRRGLSARAVFSVPFGLTWFIATHIRQTWPRGSFG